MPIWNTQDFLNAVLDLLANPFVYGLLVVGSGLIVALCVSRVIETRAQRQARLEAIEASRLKAIAELDAMRSKRIHTLVRGGKDAA
jgi:hypothetical protein